MIPRVRQVLNALYEQRASDDDAVRALLEHDGWQLPVELYAQAHKGHEQPVAPRVVVLGRELVARPGDVYLFTDDEAARRAATHVGSLAAGLAGPAAVRVALATGQRLLVNPGSPNPDTFAIELDEGSRGLLELWLAAVELEQHAAKGPLDDPALLARLHDYEGFVTYFHTAGNRVVTIPGQLGLTNGAVLFTTPDCVQAFLAKLQPEEQAGLTRVATTGAKWFAVVATGGGVDGVILNPLGPGATVALPLDVCRRVAAAG